MKIPKQVKLIKNNLNQIVKENQEAIVLYSLDNLKKEIEGMYKRVKARAEPCQLDLYKRLK